MIKKTLKVIGWALLTIVIFCLAFYFYAYIKVSGRLEKKYEIVASTLEIPSDSASLANGAHLVAIKGCTECHGEKLEGKVMNDDPVFGRLVATNLTKGKGGLPQDYSTENWLKSLKHGVRGDNTPFIFMPSHETAKLSEDDMKSLISFLQQIPAVDNELPSMDLGPLAYVLGYLEQVPLIPAEKIDHLAPLSASVDKSSLIEFGKYLAVSCTACHRDNMKGGEPAGPGMLPVPDLTSTGATGRWTVDEFAQTLRTGKRPDGSVMDNNQMPWKMTASYTNEEMTAIYQYLKSIK